MAPLFAIFEGAFSTTHILIVLIIGIIFFGKRLPEIGRSLGKGIVEFKKGMKGLEDDLDGGVAATPPARQEPAVDQIRPPQRVAATAPKFEDSPATVTPPQSTPRA